MLTLAYDNTTRTLLNNPENIIFNAKPRQLSVHRCCTGRHCKADRLVATGGWCYDSLSSFHLISVSLVHFITSLPLFDPCLNCALPFTHAFHLLYSRLRTSLNHHAQPWWLHSFPDSFWLTFMYKYLRDNYLYFNLLLRNIPHILFALKPYQLVK